MAQKLTKPEIRSLVQKTVDVHCHIGPEVIPRRYTAATLASSEVGKLRGAVLKNHFTPTVPLIEQGGAEDFLEVGSIVLNWPVGGLNPEAIRTMRTLTDKPFVVWLPTIHATQFLRESEYEIAPEWCSGKELFVRKASDVTGIAVTTSSGALTKPAQKAIQAIADAKAILATGHISWQESVAVVRYALKLGISELVLTHPVYQRVAMPLSIQAELAKQGCFIEICYSMYSLDKVPIKKLASQIQTLGPEQVILSSDMGQLSSPSPSEGLQKFCLLLQDAGISADWLEKMLVENPKRLLRL